MAADTRHPASGTASAVPGERPFRRHKFLDYQGYAFPWYITLLWIAFFTGGILYLVRYLLFE